MMITESGPTQEERDRKTRRQYWFAGAYALLGTANMALGFERASWSLQKLFWGDWEIGIGLLWLIMAGMYVLHVRRSNSVS